MVEAKSSASAAVPMNRPVAYNPSNMEQHTQKMEAANATPEPQAKTADGTISSFLNEHKNCITRTPQEFSDWLGAVGVETLDDLAEALDDKDFAKEEMQPNGLKYFKRQALRKAILERESTRQADLQYKLAAQHVTASVDASITAPSELICPISLELMVNDPVVASDGFTYERRAIEDWFAKKTRDGAPLLSPQTQTILSDATLIPNVAIRTMSREFAASRRIPDS